MVAGVIFEFDSGATADANVSPTRRASALAARLSDCTSAAYSRSRNETTSPTCQPASFFSTPTQAVWEIVASWLRSPPFVSAQSRTTHAVATLVKLGI